MIKKILIGLAAVIAIIFGVAATRPDTFSITRSLAINSTPEAAYAQINDLENFNQWSPWAKIDPDAKFAFEGPESGVDQSLVWNGNGEVGEGRMTIVESNPHQSVKMRLDFKRPFESVADTLFEVKQEGGQVVVSWNMSGKSNLIGRVFCMFMDQDKMVGGQFEIGLKNLQKILEGN